ncbi:hypothetical protein JRD95_00165 [Rickettsia parkeri]|nr:hypothetical protein MC1_00825 [Rickettsia parkeri str. Portsmouth]KJV93380.1 hypothetical protein RPAGB_1499 [Rickettsia parkeri str. Grand Bay]QWB86121.1 hypothetical protein JRD95_00165 [Rickettsia parkeri]
MNDQTKNGSEELKYLSSDKSLKPQKVGKNYLQN